MIKMLARAALCTILTMGALLSAPAQAQDAGFKPKQITIYVGFSPTTGIGYDTYARTLAMFYGK
jgi:tripartite-type tricarboxylate transporter receptor subunit TctC